MPIVYPSEIFPGCDVVDCALMSEWIDERRKGIGSSDAAGVMRESTWTSPLQVYWAKRGLRDDGDTTWLRIGKALEDGVAQLFADETGIAAMNPGAFSILRNRARPWELCTLDRVALDPADPTACPLEIKTSNAFVKDDWRDGVPRAYWIQVQHQLMVTGAPRGFIAVLLGGAEFKHAEIVRDEGFIATLRAECEALWLRITSGDAPDAIGADNAAMGTGIPAGPEAKHVQLDGDAWEWDSAFERAQALRREADELGDVAAARIKQRMGDAHTASLPNGTTYSWKPRRDGVRVFTRKVAP